MLCMKNVSYVYGEDTAAAVKNINLEVGDGTFLAVLGHNGSGKSTLAKLLNGILLPTSGNVTVMGMDTKEHTDAIRRHVGMVFQNPDNQIVATIVEEDVAFGPENLGIPPLEIRERVDNALRAVNMYAFRKHAPHLLSGGQKQRVAIAGILAMQPSYIILDEPTAMLDPVGRREVMATIKELRKKTGMTIVLITHFMREAAEADRVIIMEHGEICMDGTPEEVLTQRESLKAHGLEVPQVTELMHRLYDKGMPLRTDILDVDTAAESICTAIRERKNL